MIVVKVEGITSAIDTMNLITNRLPEVGDKDLWNLSQILGSELRKGMKMAGIKDFRGTLREGTFPHKTGKYEYELMLPRHARWLDSMQPHSVWLYDKPELQQWAEERLGYPEGFGGSLFVRPRPFIQGAFDRLEQRITSELENGKIVEMVKGGK